MTKQEIIRFVYTNNYTIDDVHSLLHSYIIDKNSNNRDKQLKYINEFIMNNLFNIDNIVKHILKYYIIKFNIIKIYSPQGQLITII